MDRPVLVGAHCMRPIFEGRMRPAFLEPDETKGCRLVKL